jgi:hypothetical protein
MLAFDSGRPVKFVVDEVVLECFLLTSLVFSYYHHSTTAPYTSVTAP